LDAARLVRTAAALELLIIAAPRLDNLNHLDIENSFRRAACGMHRITHMVVDAMDVKNGVPIPHPSELYRWGLELLTQADEPKVRGTGWHNTGMA